MTHLLRSLSGLQRLAALCGTLVAVACATTAPRPTPPAPPAVSVPVTPPRFTSGNTKFDAFLESARVKALAQGIRPSTFDSAVAGITPAASIAASNANQPEFARAVWSYLDGAVSARRVADGKIMLSRHGDTLASVAAASGVPKEILTAIWGIETDYGAGNGSFNLFEALATLAYDGPRMAFAEPEFFAALKIYQEQQYARSEMVASWAGAFGQTQFTPTTFLKFAKDGDGDGRINLWRSEPDALASAANLLVQQGWKSGQPWGFEVQLPSGFAYEEADTDSQKPLADWQARGVKTVDGKALPASGDSAAIYLPAGARGPAFLVFPNFSVILKYNNAASYALAVGLLADRIAGGGMVKRVWPRDERSLSREERLRFQDSLAKLGFDPGVADGVLGRRTRAAVRAYQKSKSVVADGFATASLLAMLDKDVSTR